MHADIEAHAVSSGLVALVSHSLQFVMNLLGIVILSRLLTPQDFGVVAMVMVVMGFLRVFNDGGLSTATIQREGITHAQVSNLFWANIALGGLSTLLLLAAAPAIGWFYRDPSLVTLTFALCASPLLSTAAVQHRALLTRQMRFVSLALIDVSAMAASVGIAVAMAMWGYRYWALVGQQLTVLVISLGLSWYACEWRPQRPQRSSGTRSLLHFGATLSAGGFLWSLARGADGLLIGRVFGASQLGLYTRAGALVRRPVEQLMGPLETVVVPTLSRLQSQPERYRHVVLQVHSTIALVSLMAAAILLAVPYPLTLVVLGGRWESAAPILAGFTAVALYTPIASVASWLLRSQGRGQAFLAQSVIGSLSTVVSTLVGLPFGPVGVAISYSVFCLFISLPVVYYIGGRVGPVHTTDLWRGVFQHIPVFVSVFAATWLAREFLSSSEPLPQLLGATAAGLLTAVVAVFVTPSSRAVVVNVAQTVSELRHSRVD